MLEIGKTQQKLTKPRKYIYDYDYINELLAESKRNE